MSSKRPNPNPSNLTSKLHTNLLRLTQITSTPTGLDATLATICYTCLLLHTHLRSKPPALKTLYTTFEDHRILTRLLGLLPLYASIAEARQTQHRDPIVKTLLYASLAAGTAFQALENVAVLVQRGVLRGRKWREWEGWCWVVSCRFWLGQLVLEIGRLARVRQLGWREELGAEGLEGKGEEREGGEVWSGRGQVEVQSARLARKWWREVYLTAASVPLAMHWSFEEERSPVSEVLFAGMGLISGLIGLQDAWDEAAV
ncbi:hypothetical protein WHR41_01042 [Cladosporium halotolerans]|uniref:Peroxin 11C n=1 Tax=Cladosporium halotolerans TaxID=1052096 RepID=A0AB34L4N5_9PEZI